MVELIDPIRDAIVRDLLQFRKQPGHPGPHRLDGLFHLIEALGEGIPERAFDELTRLYEDLGRDPATDVGAYFYLCGWNVGLGSIDERRLRYVAEHYAEEISAPWGRAKKGVYELATIIRDREETNRPSVVVSIFQSGAAFQPILDFTMAYESWQPPTVLVNGEQMGRIFVHWPMPMWPTWRLLAWVPAPRILTQMRTVRNRAVEVSLTRWKRNTDAAR